MVYLFITRSKCGCGFGDSFYLQGLQSNCVLIITYISVRPTKISVTGVQHHVVQGTRVTLQCIVQGARPAANVTWYNSTRPVDDNIISTGTTEKVFRDLFSLKLKSENFCTSINNTLSKIVWPKIFCLVFSKLYNLNSHPTPI